MFMTGSISSLASALAALRQQPLVTAGASSAAAARNTNATGSANAAFDLFAAAGSAGGPAAPAGGAAPASPFSPGTFGVLIDQQARQTGSSGEAGISRSTGRQMAPASFTGNAAGSTQLDAEQMLATLLQPQGPPGPG